MIRRGHQRIVKQMRACVVGVLLMIVGMSSVAGACSLGPLAFLLPEINNRVRYQADGSFRNAGVYDQVRGLAISDLGSGRLMQPLWDDATCSTVQLVMLTDCMVADVLVLAPDLGDTDLDVLVPLQGTYDASSLLPPQGVLAAVSEKPIRDMAAYAVKLGARLDSFLLTANSAEKLRDRFDPLKGCKIFYPSSPGAT